MWLPASVCVGQEHPGALGVGSGESRVEFLRGGPALRIGDDEGGVHDLEASPGNAGRPLHPRAGEGAEALALEIMGNSSQHLRRVGAGAATWVEDVDVSAAGPSGILRSSFGALSTSATT